VRSVALALVCGSTAAAAAASASVLREPMRPAAVGQLNWVLSNDAQHAYLAPQPPLPFAARGTTTGAAATPVVEVDSTVLLQEIHGFGGALTESSASVFEKLTPDAQARFLEAYYGASGNRYSLARTHIASCDFALDYYSYQTQEGDFNMTTFNMTRDHQRLIPFLKAAQAAVANASSSSSTISTSTSTSTSSTSTSTSSTGSTSAPLRIVASPWSPPHWLKECDELFCLGIGCPLRKEEPAKPYRTAYAMYLSKYLDEMSANGIEPWAITPQNEPLTCKPLMESMGMDAADQRDFVGAQLGPMLRARHPGVKLLAFDHNKDFVAVWAKTLLASDSPAKPYVDGLAFHWYASDDCT
jgi:glucosylceramidase